MRVRVEATISTGWWWEHLEKIVEETDYPMIDAAFHKVMDIEVTPDNTYRGKTTVSVVFTGLRQALVSLNCRMSQIRKLSVQLR